MGVSLRSEKINKYFGITHAVKDASIEFNAGEIHGLIGENGSGKSTFCSMLCGIHNISSGQFFLNGKSIAPGNLIEANEEGVSIIVQEIGTLPGLTVAENIFLGKEKQFMKAIYRNTKRMNREAQQILDSYGYSRIKATSMIDNYNFEDRKLVEIVKATYFTPEVLVVDETTTALSQSGRDDLFKIMNDLKAKGKTIIFISHDMAEVMERTDRVSCLRDGDYVGTVNTKEVTADDLKRMMVGRDLKGKYYRTDYGTPISGKVVLDVKDVSVPGKIHNINFQLHKGEILGFGGLSDSGMHEVGKAVFAASYDRTGTVTLSDGTQIKEIKQAIGKSIAYASKDRDNESIICAAPIKDNVALPSLADLRHGLVIKDKEVNTFADKYATQMSTKMTSIKQDVSELSGGNKQKVVLARWLGKNSDILVLDSPTRGIDIKVKAVIYNLMDDLRKQGKSILMISEELPELMGMSDRIIIMKDGEIKQEFRRDTSLTEQDIISAMV